MPDQRLRRFGFRILARPEKGPAIWIRRGRQYTEAQAHEQADRDLKAALANEHKEGKKK